MDTIFISYAREDFHFAELLKLKLQALEFNVWLDSGELKAGEDWQDGIERGLQESALILVVLSEGSIQSQYVTFEWAYAMGQGKAILPLKIKECSLHPRLESLHYLDFSKPTEQPWQRLEKDISATLADFEPAEDTIEPIAAAPDDALDPNVDKILQYLSSRGFQMASFDRLHEKNIWPLSEPEFDNMIEQNSHIFRPARLKGGKRGIAKL